MIENTTLFVVTNLMLRYPKKILTKYPVKHFLYYKKSPKTSPKSGNKLFPNTKFAVKARIIEWVIIIYRLDGVRKFLFKPFLSFDNNLI